MRKGDGDAPWLEGHGITRLVIAAANCSDLEADLKGF
jgi:hypothetical protein